MSKREKNLLIALGLVGAAALAIFLLTRGGGEPEEGRTPAELNRPSTTVPEAAEQVVVGNPLAGPDCPGRPHCVSAPRFHLSLGGRDPFVPLVEPPEVTAASTTGAATAPSGAPSSGTTGTSGSEALGPSGTKYPA